MDASDLARFCNKGDVIVSNVAGKLSCVASHGRSLLEHNSTEPEEESHATLIVLYFFFALSMGCLFMYLLNRLYKDLPFSAVIFILGVVIGVCNQSLYENGRETAMAQSIQMWSNIHPHLFLQLFLPPLIFKDAITLNYQMFKRAIWQILWLAFPAVVLGASIVMALALYTIPVFEGRLYLAFTFGSILAATDPVAVLSLLEEVGGSARLNTLIAGESLLNDGSAMVMFTIFNNLYLFNVNLGGEDYTVGEGFAVFFQMAFGGALIGLSFGLIQLLVLWVLDHKLETSDKIMQTASMISLAYLCYFTSETMADASGVLAVVVMGVFLGGHADSAILDRKFLEDVWTTLVFMATTMIFIIGGNLWGSALVDSDRAGHVTGIDVAYLFLIYVYITITRAALLYGSYPLLVRIGLGTDIREVTFMVWSGLRGAIGIALAVTLDLTIRQATDAEDVELRTQGSKVLFYVGGVALMTLLINGLTAGPMVGALKLANVSFGRKMILRAIHNELVKTTFSIVKVYKSGGKLFSVLDEDRLRYLIDDLNVKHPKDRLMGISTRQDVRVEHGAKRTSLDRAVAGSRRHLPVDFHTSERIESEELLHSNRQSFLRIVSGMYISQIDIGWIRQDSLTGDLLVQSAELAADRSCAREALNDWEWLQKLMSNSVPFVLESIQASAQLAWKRFDLTSCSCKCDCSCAGERQSMKDLEAEIAQQDLQPGESFSKPLWYVVQEEKIFAAILFLKCHKHARRRWKGLFQVETHHMEKVLEESLSETRKAEEFLETCEPRIVQSAISYLVASYILTKQAHVVESALDDGIITEAEAQNFMVDITKQRDRLSRVDESIVQLETPFTANESDQEFHARLCEALDVEFDNSRGGIVNIRDVRGLHCRPQNGATDLSAPWKTEPNMTTSDTPLGVGSNPGKISDSAMSSPAAATILVKTSVTGESDGPEQGNGASNGTTDDSSDGSAAPTGQSTGSSEQERDEATGEQRPEPSERTPGPDASLQVTSTRSDGKDQQTSAIENT